MADNRDMSLILRQNSELVDLIQKFSLGKDESNSIDHSRL